ncbi:putative asparagine synthase [Roridomyces roridus]|uniref:Asparagine synthase n=1 Tax=Roridomyces roridus TaxID=1738132 RepID=A0AAD7BDG9_9AGAR|nr:putative asparagine synthase [Roridomyces roridus]
MCGLTAIFHSDAATRPSVDVLQQKLEASLELIKHRGPDSRGTYVSPDARVGLGHVRLAIIDLATGQQPLSDEDDLIHCVVTGEIYDHDRIRVEMQREEFSFKTKSDSELVVQLYKRDGINLLFSLRGELAFVLYDVKRRMLLAARDRFGIKPLYYTVLDGRVLFASEMKAFMGLGWQPEWDLDSIAHNGDIGDERTVFKGVFKLGAGHLALCGPSGQLRLERYWDVSYPSPSATTTQTIDEMIQSVRDMLIESVRLRLRADVPLAVYLSGGLDSSTVAGIATHVLREANPEAKVTAFTLAYIEDAATDESPIAIRTAEHLGAEIHAVPATEAGLVEVFEEAVWHSEQIITSFHGSGKILLSKAVRENGYKVALSGEGSDELFAGYPWFLLDYLRSADPAAQALGIPTPTADERLALLEERESKATYPQISTEGVEVDRAALNLLAVGAHHVVSTLSLFDGRVLRAEVVERTGESNVVRCMAEALDPRVRQHSLDGSWHPVNVSMYATTKSLMTNIILNQCGDRADMVHAIESRVAFLDHQLVEYVTSLPPSVKLMPSKTDGNQWSFTEKWILRKAAQPFITAEVFNRKKIPFNPPPQPRTQDGLQKLTPLQEHFQHRITQPAVERTGFLDWVYINGILREYLETPIFSSDGAVDKRARRLMGVLSFVVLQERFGVPTAKLM